MTIKELYELAEEHCAENKELVIGAFDKNGWYSDYSIEDIDVLLHIYSDKVKIAL